MDSSSKSDVTVVLVHGAWGDASSWRRVIPLLHEKGLRVIAVQNPTSSLENDVAATRLALNQVGGPVVLAGHSWGGTVITEAGNDPKVRALVYVAAFAPDAGQSTSDQVGAHSAPPGLGGVQNDGEGNLMITAESWVANVAQDLPEAEARVLAAVQTPLGQQTFTDKITRAAWKGRATWYIVSADDRAVSVDLQRDLAARMGARITELQSSHMSLLSQPRAVAEVIVQAADHVAT